MLSSVLVLIRQFTWFKKGLDCARHMHDRLLRAVLRAPMSFFFATPTGALGVPFLLDEKVADDTDLPGRIVTRFSKDQGSVDQDIPDMVSDFFLCMFISIGGLGVICALQPLMILFLVPVLASYWWVMQNYRKASRGTRHCIQSPGPCDQPLTVYRLDRARQARLDDQFAYLQPLLGDA